MIQKHPDNDPANDHPRVDDSVISTVDQSLEEHQEGVLAEGLEDGLMDAGDLGGTLEQPRPASTNAVLDDHGVVGTSMGQRFSKAGRELADHDADHQKHRPAIKARRASSQNAGNDEATVSGAVSSGGHLSGIELVGIAASRQNFLERDWSPESVNGSHLSGTTRAGHAGSTGIMRDFAGFFAPLPARYHPRVCDNRHTKVRYQSGLWLQNEHTLVHDLR